MAAEAGTAVEAPGGPAGSAGRPGEPGDGPRGDQFSWYGDSAYGTGDLRDAIGQAGHRAVIKPKPLQAPVEGGFTADDFAVDAGNSTVTCPADVTRTIRPAAMSSSAPPAAPARCAPVAPRPSPGGPSA